MDIGGLFYLEMCFRDMCAANGDNYNHVLLTNII